MSEGEMERRRLAELASFAEQNHLTPSRTPALERWTLPDEQGIPVSACLRDSGWNARATAGGSLLTDVPEAQRSAMHLTQYGCLACFSIDPRFLAQPTPQMYGAVWSYFHDYGLPCLARFGFSPDTPLPTQETFVATNGRWGLYPASVTVPEDVEVVCPQIPPTRAMFEVPG